ncbi:MAG: large subunit ribosomal protein L31 [Alphaproteobacteria bacterium]|jgi:large subunit ribosomal protein L31
MARKDIHPEKKIVTVTMNDGVKYDLKMLLPNGSEQLTLDVDPTTHPAWREDGERQLLDTGGRVSRFTKKYGGIF